jgi:hypothetical protein
MRGGIGSDGWIGDFIQRREWFSICWHFESLVVEEFNLMILFCQVFPQFFEI